MRRAAREIFDDALSKMDAGQAVRRAVERRGSRLRVFEEEFDLVGRRAPKIYSVAIGKAAASMAAALEESLGEHVAGGVLSAPPTDISFPHRWRVFAGGHPLPDEASLDAARASFELLRKADDHSALIIFLISGGGSAMLELPRDERVTLADLRETNRVLVSCGAGITEVNVVRRALSIIKGGGLSALAPRAAQLTLIVSDTATNRADDVASGPTFPSEISTEKLTSVVAKYDLAARLPASVTRALGEFRDGQKVDAHVAALRKHYVLLDNESALKSAAEAARARGFIVETASDLVEQPVEEGSRELVARLVEFYRREGTGGKCVCLVSGGEFACPVRGRGVGGRNAETALRCALEMARCASQSRRSELPAQMSALCAGTDGIDGNSPAAGALADQTTLGRALDKGLDAKQFLDESDAYTFFDALGDTVVTGPTGTNVRDLRILLAG
jgi:hydroxypyruvate reductase